MSQLDWWIAAYVVATFVAWPFLVRSFVGVKGDDDPATWYFVGIGWLLAPVTVPVFALVAVSGILGRFLCR